MPHGDRAELFTQRVWITLADGHRFSGPLVQVTVDPQAGAASLAPLRVPWTQPRVSELLERDPWLSVAEVGSGYVLFDLRPLRGRLLRTRASTLRELFGD